jgi:type IV secretory pathway TraG/TraD family ATPase VirD4
MSFSGGTGIFVTAVLQSLAQARNRWGHDAAAMLWGAATVKAVLGGLAGEDLREVSELSGEYRETVISWQRGHGGSSLSSSLQDRKTLTPEQVRTLSAQRREALIIHATTPAVLTRMTRHYEGPAREIFAASVREARITAGLDPPPRITPPTAKEAETRNAPRATRPPDDPEAPWNGYLPEFDERENYW